jgi:hypothetical protein
MFKVAGASVDREHVVCEDGSRRIDLLVDFRNEKLYIDVTMPTPEVRSNRGKTDAGLEASCHNKKLLTYGRLAHAEGYEVHTFFIDTHGRMSKKSRALLSKVWKAIAEDPEREGLPKLTFNQFLTPLSEVVAKGNALCVWKSGILKQLGVDHSNLGRGRCPNPSGANHGTTSDGCDDDDDTTTTHRETQQPILRIHSQKLSSSPPQQNRPTGGTPVTPGHSPNNINNTDNPNINSNNDNINTDTDNHIYQPSTPLNQHDNDNDDSIPRRESRGVARAAGP